jgi:hypothetical protein
MHARLSIWPFKALIAIITASVAAGGAMPRLGCVR